jgi:UDPglucose 6-dehydrogenase
MKRIGVVGVGAIGSAIMKLFPEAIGFDIALCKETFLPRMKYIQHLPGEISGLDIIFLCVPTPHIPGDGLDMSEIYNVAQTIAKGQANEKRRPVVVSCSTLQPGTADDLVRRYNLRLVVQPEYFGESVSHPLVDLRTTPFMILGGESEDVEEVISLYQTVYNANTKIRRVTRLEAEVIKLSENRAIAFKVLQCQELYDACQAHGVDYNTVREAVYGDDPRFNLWWTFVYSENRGLNSKCLPKDLYGWFHWYPGPLTECLLNYNRRLRSGS